MKILKYLKRQLWLYMGYRWLLDSRVIESDVIEVVTLVRQGAIGYRVTVERILHLKEDIANYRKLYTKLSKRNANETWVSLTELDEILDSTLDVSFIDAYEEAHLINCMSNWDVSKVTDMSSMFKGCKSNWDVSSVTDLTDAFKGCDSFNPSVHKWGDSCVTNIDDVNKD